MDPRMNSGQPNIIYIMPDQWRFDALGTSDTFGARTPNLDRLARRGMVVRGLHCESPICQPSRASLLTGRWPRQHGLIDNDLSRWAQPVRFPNPYMQTFVRELRDSGYHTAGVGKLNFWFPQVIAKDHIGHEVRARLESADPRDVLRSLYGYGDVRKYCAQTMSYGFDEIHEEADKQSLLLYDSDYTDKLKAMGALEGWRDQIADDIGEFLISYLAGRDVPMVGASGAPVVPEDLDPGDTLDAFVADRACDVVQRHDQSKPLFLWVGFVGPHPPYDTPESYEWDGPENVPGATLEPPGIPDNEWGRYLSWTIDRTGAGRFDDSDWGSIQRQYLARCSLIDDGIGRIVSALEARGMDNTWVVFGSDHGDMLGDHHMVAKRLFYRSSVEVPGIVASLEQDTGGVVVEGLHQNFDLTATIIDLAGANGSWHRGSSLLPDAQNQINGREAVFSQIAHFLMVRTKQYKLIVDERTATPQVLFDLVNDPAENIDLLGTSAASDVVNDLMDRHVTPFLRGEIVRPG